MKRERGERIGGQKGALVYAVQDKRPVVVPPHRAGARAMPTFDGNTKCLTCVYRTCVWPNTVCGYLLAEGRSRWHSQKVPFGDACTLYMEGDPEDIEWKTM